MRLSARARRYARQRVALATDALEDVSDLFGRNTKLASFDVFDTVLTRTVASPTDIHELVGAELLRDGAIDIPGSEWKQARVDAEVAARTLSSSEEVTLEEIYAVLTDRLGLSGSTRDRAVDLEVREEARHLVPMAATSRLVQESRMSGRRVAFVSNMYLPREAIEAQLRRFSLMQDDDILLVSSEHGVHKQSGKLFRRLVQESGVEGSSIRHLGDNWHADYHSARKAGLRACWFRGGVTTRYESKIEPEGDTRLACSLITGSSRAVRLSRTFDAERERIIWEVSAGVAGPLLVGFVLWCLRQAEGRGMRRLYFFARDGQILAKIAEILALRLNIPVESRYVMASRRALLGPILDPNSDGFPERFARVAYAQRLGDLAACLEITEDRLLKHVPMDLRWLASGKSQLNMESALRLGAHLMNSPLRQHLAQLSASRRQAMLTYLRGEGMFDEVEAGIVDVGWKGNQQAMLKEALSMGKAADTPSITGFYLALSDGGHGIGEHHEYSRDRSIFNAVLVELLCAADHGTTLAYKDQGQGGRPVAEESNLEAEAWGLKIQQQAICQFAQTVAERLCDARIDLDTALAAFRTIGTENFVQFRREPSIGEADVYGRFRHSQGVQHAKFPEVGAEDSMLVSMLWFLGLKPSRSPWGQGSFLRSFARWRIGRVGAGLLWLRAKARRKLRP